MPAACWIAPWKRSSSLSMGLFAGYRTDPVHRARDLRGLPHAATPERVSEPGRVHRVILCGRGTRMRRRYYAWNRK